ncbi:MAG: putative carbohydrate kinase [Nitrososphaeraceae archaeon]|nr:putative carbohydrate kinase [Nitrososphaeraceae archaeon]
MSDDKLTIGSANRLVAMIPKKPNTAAIGMGMSLARPEALHSLINALKSSGTRLLLDSSSLLPAVLKEISGTDTIITPHAGEYKRIFGENAGADEKERISNVYKFAKEYDITILLRSIYFGCLFQWISRQFGIRSSRFAYGSNRFARTYT